jgi:hypothetical protein
MRGGEMKAEFKGASGSGGAEWSTPGAWVSGQVPTSSLGLNVQIDTASTENLGTASSPFLTNDIIGASVGLTSPSIDVTGFLHAGDIGNLSFVGVEGNAALTARNIANVRDLTTIGRKLNVSNDIINTQQFTATEESVDRIGGSLINVQKVGASFGATIEVGRSLGTAQVTLGGIGSGTLILDHPESHHLTNAISFLGTNDTIELGNLVFDTASFLPNSPGATTGKLQLSEHGHPVYQLTDVTIPANGTFSVGTDTTTGHHEILFTGH